MPTSGETPDPQGSSRFYGSYWLVRLMREGKTYDDLRDPAAWEGCRVGTYDASKWAFEWFERWSTELEA